MVKISQILLIGKYMKNVLKIAFLGILGIFVLTYMTADKPTALNAKEVTSGLSYKTLPNDFELVGQDKRVTKQNLFKQGSKALIVVGNHDSLAVVKELPKHYNLETSYVMVANISSAPWFVKKLFIPGKLEDLNQGSNIPMIYDFEGNMVNALEVTNNAKTAFAAFMLNENGSIAKIYEGNVKEGALDGSMSNDEIKAALLPLSKLVK